MATKKKKKPRPSYRSILGPTGFAIAMLALVFAVLSAACTTSSSSLSTPRVTTEAERTEAIETLQLIETGAVAAQVAGKLKPGDLSLIVGQLAELEQAVQRSESEPVSWRSIARQIAVLAAAWIVRDDGG